MAMWLLLMACGWLAPDHNDPVPDPVAIAAHRTPWDPRSAPKAQAPSFMRALALEEATVVRHVTGAERPDPPEWTEVGPSAPLTGQAAELAALGYVDGEVDADGRSVGLMTHDPTRTEPGYTFTSPGGHALAVLLDMQGQEVHRWRYAVTDAWPDFDTDSDLRHITFRRAQLLRGGDLVLIWSGFGIARIASDSRLVWANLLPVHHDLWVAEDGSVISLMRLKSVIERIDPKHEVLEDFVVWLDPQGHVTRQLSLLAAFERFDGFHEIWRSRPKTDRDLFHTNALHVIERDLTHLDPAWRKGNLLLSMRHLDAIAVLDPEAEEIVWAFKDDFVRQHDPTLAGENLLLFDNRGGPRKTSRVLEYNIATRQVVASYRGNDQHPFASRVCGSAQRLPNGNTLINESTEGRAFEIDAAGEIVWEYRTPFRTLAARREKMVVSRINELTRVPADFVEDWLPRQEPR